MVTSQSTWFYKTILVSCLVIMVSGQTPPTQPDLIYKTQNASSGDLEKLVYLASTSKLFVENHLLARNLVNANSKFPISLVLDGAPILLRVFIGSVIIENKGDYNVDGVTTAVIPNGPTHVVANTIGNCTLSTLDPLGGIKLLAKNLANKVTVWTGKLKFENPFQPVDTPDGIIYPIVINDNLVDVKFTASGVTLHPEIPGYKLNNEVTLCYTVNCTSVGATLDPADNYTVLASGQFNPDDYLIILTVDIKEPEEVFRRVFEREIKKRGVRHIAIEPKIIKRRSRRTVYTLPTKPYSEIIKYILKVSNNPQSNYLHLVKYNTYENSIGALNTYYRSVYPSWVDFISFSGNFNQEKPSIIYQFMVDLQSKPYFTVVYNGCPTLGVDGTEGNIPAPPVLIGKLTGKSGSFASVDSTETWILLSEGFGGYVEGKPFYAVYPEYYLLTLEEYISDPTLLYTKLVELETKIFGQLATIFFP